MRRLVYVFLLGSLLTCSVKLRAEGMSALAFGSGSRASLLAPAFQERARRLIRESGRRLVEPAEALNITAPPEKTKALEEGRKLLREAKADYEQLELEKAVNAFSAALARLEAAFGILSNPQELSECLLYLGACNILLGETGAAREYFLRALDFGAYDSQAINAFPPNIQQSFRQTYNEWKTAERAAADFTSEPPGALLFVDGAYQGCTPLTIAGLRATNHLGQAVKDGYLPWGGYLRLVAGKKRSLRVSLRPAAEAGPFFSKLRKLEAELARGAPGQAAADMLKLLGVERLIILQLAESPSGLAATVFSVGDLEVRREVILTSDVHPTSLDELLLELIKADASEQPAQASASGAGDELGLDLSLSDEAAAGEVQPEKAPAAETPATESEAASGQVATEEEGESAGPESESEKTPSTVAASEEAPSGGQPAPPPPAWYQGLWKRWWFWTAVAVLASGAATGGYLLSAQPSSGGRLTIQLH